MRKIWPIHLHPKHDELMSSWLVRLAFSYRLTPYSFSHTILPHIKIWTRDIDLHGNSELEGLLSQKTGTPIEKVKQTLLLRYDSKIVEQINRAGNNFWILPLGKYHRINQDYGMMACPQCLKESPYFKTFWRLSCCTICLKHRCYFIDRCQRCGQPINFHKVDVGHSINQCFNCGCTLTNIVLNPLQRELKAQLELYQILCFGWYSQNSIQGCYSHLFFNVLHKVVLTIMKLRHHANKNHFMGQKLISTEQNFKLFNEFPIKERSRILTSSIWLLKNWPERLIRVSRRFRLWESYWTKDISTLPFWFLKVAKSSLSKKQRYISEEEIVSAIKYCINQTHEFPSKRTVENLLDNVSMFQRTRARRIYVKLFEGFHLNQRID